MKYLPAITVALGLVATPALAALNVGDAAPNFTAEASLGGKEFSFSLADALKKGPVVLYFYPAAFTPGCTIEAHEFADATDEFKKLGATVIGVSADEIKKLVKFSVSDCRSKFAVAADPDLKVIKAYDAQIGPNVKIANRISYVISPEGKVLYTYTDRNPEHHVENTMKVVKEWDAKHAGKQSGQ
jgi:peroxiredoxin Q/BCP